MFYLHWNEHRARNENEEHLFADYIDQTLLAIGTRGLLLLCLGLCFRVCKKSCFASLQEVLRCKFARSLCLLMLGKQKLSKYHLGYRCFVI